MTKPKLLMMDEPSLGLAPLVVKMIFDIIKEINAQGTTILLVEQNAHVALEICDRGYVLEIGKVTLSDDGADLLTNPHVQEAYLGVA
jgi:branched-chain amino acid transport system ATP-binding protein